jgi:membrane carboxypeptidase/penicillin-binding protein PbpC
MGALKNAVLGLEGRHFFQHGSVNYLRLRKKMSPDVVKQATVFGL